MVDRHSRKIQQMFGAIAPRYDLLNRLLSLSVDRYWRRYARQKVARALPEGAKVLDLCTGTADLAIEMSEVADVFGCDFSHPMLVEGIRKIRSQENHRIQLVEGDALQLPFRSGLFDGVTIAFGLRNLEDYTAGIAEMNRVLHPGGVLGVLEFSKPDLPGLKQIYQLYFNRVLPKLGGLVSGDGSAYGYLPKSVTQFPGPVDLSQMLRGAGFSKVEYFKLTGGIAFLHVAEK
jgi:demethylmenaquinone methyltransferase/2-methoxy-6-polyprenyl-1,4-benzoquinol methylase